MGAVRLIQWVTHIITPFSQDQEILGLAADERFIRVRACAWLLRSGCQEERAGPEARTRERNFSFPVMPGFIR